MWRRPAAHDALRGGTCTAYSQRKMVVAEGMGRASRSATRDASSVVAVARRLAVVLHRMWVDGNEFRWSKKDSTRFRRLPEAAAKNAGKPPSRRKRVLL